MTSAPLRCPNCDLLDDHRIVGHVINEACLQNALALLRECRPYVARDANRERSGEVYSVEARNLLSRMPP